MKIEISQNTLDLIFNAALNENISINLHKNSKDKRVINIDENNISNWFDTIDYLITNFRLNKLLD